MASGTLFQLSDSVQSKLSPQPPLSEPAKRALAFAAEQATGLGHHTIDCGHLLYALCNESKGLASVVLKRTGVLAEQVRAILKDTPSDPDRAGGWLEMSEEANAMIVQAAAVALAWGDGEVDTEHMLFAIVSMRSSAHEVLDAMGVVRDEILRELTEIRPQTLRGSLKDAPARAYYLTLESAWLMSLGHEVACRHGSGTMTALHLFIALATIDSESQRFVNEHLGLTGELLERRLEPRAVQKDLKATLGVDVQRALGRAIAEAWSRGHQAITPLHIALGIADSGRNDALDLLADFGISQATLIDLLEARLPPRVHLT